MQTYRESLSTTLLRRLRALRAGALRSALAMTVLGMTMPACAANGLPATAAAEARHGAAMPEGGSSPDGARAALGSAGIGGAAEPAPLPTSPPRIVPALAARAPGPSATASAGAERQPPELLGCSSCYRQFATCLYAATAALAGCLARSPSPIQEAVCYVKYELDLFLCAQEFATCELVCRR